MPSETNPYTPSNIALLEMLYGKDLISLGGTAAIDHLFSDLNIHGLTALDVGFGLGGVAFYLAKQYQMAISGVEIHPWMVEYARNHAPANLITPLTFNTYTDDGEIPFASESFELVYSKGVLNHVHDKAPLFRQIYTALKPNGLLVIADWLVPHMPTLTTGPLTSETRESYEQVLSDTGFNQIRFRDDSALFLEYVKSFVTNLNNKKDIIIRVYDNELFTMIWKQHQELIESIKDRQKIATRIIATKR